MMLNSQLIANRILDDGSYKLHLAFGNLYASLNTKSAISKRSIIKENSKNNRGIYLRKGLNG